MPIIKILKTFLKILNPLYWIRKFLNYVWYKKIKAHQFDDDDNMRNMIWDTCVTKSDIVKRNRVAIITNIFIGKIAMLNVMKPKTLNV